MKTMKNVGAKAGMLACLMWLGTGCPTDPEPTPDTGRVDASADVGLDDMDAMDAQTDVSDAEVDMPLDVSPDADACVPRTECPVDTCGMVDDGCAGELDCGACDCVDGQPTQPTCGPCGVGSSSCDVDGTLSCTQPQIPDIESLACNKILYVDQGALGGLEQGTRSEPYTTLSDALSLAGADPDRRLVLITQEGPLEEGFLVVPDGVSIVGGYTRAWTYTQEKTRLIAGGLDPETSSNEHYKAMAISQTTQPMLLEGLKIEMSAAEGTGRNAIAITVDTASDLLFDRMDVTAGRGSDGAPGGSGGSGLDGVSGEDADDRVTPNQPAPDPADNIQTVAMCPDGIGGDGGLGGTSPTISAQVFGYPVASQRGEDSPLGGLGGLSGDDQFREVGAPGGAGAQGDAGESGSLPDPLRNDGSVSLSFRVLPGLGLRFGGMDGADGLVGATGQGGGGGGGASWFTRRNSSNNLVEYPGGSGGGGGHGGCGGQPGEGGTGAGSSVGLLVRNSPNLRIRRSSITAGEGGTGGQGGLGGLGGQGGAGGQGTYRYSSLSESLINKGGDGGRGGQGGPGGLGSGGHGGHSIGVVCDRAVDVDSESVLRAGLAGRGGRGETSSGDGAILAQYGCQD